MGLLTLSDAARGRLTGLGLAAIAFAFTAVDGVFGMQDLLYLLRGFSEQRPVITSSQYAGTALLLAPMGFSFGVMCLFAKKATPEQMKKAAENRSPWAIPYLLFVAGSIAAAFAAPIVQHIIVDHLATNRGYVSCPTPKGERHQPDRWAISPAHCPGDGADPNS